MTESAHDTSITVAEKAAHKRVRALGVDLGAMDAVANIFRVANSIRNKAERDLLAQHGLSFTGFTVLWVLWVWGSRESHQLAQESSVSKSTLTGIIKTLHTLKLVERKAHPSDGRRLIIAPTQKTLQLMEELFPRFNQLEKEVTSGLTKKEKSELIKKLRTILHALEE
jgi:DNA-binding MarR family transcriptional regulator